VTVNLTSSNTSNIGYLNAGTYSGIESFDISGVDSGNYIDNLKGGYTVTPIANLNWIGGTGDWSTASNWKNNILPSTGNVLDVTIPSNGVVTYHDNVQLFNLKSSGTFLMAGGQLDLTGNFNSTQFVQSGGALTVGGSYHVQQYALDNAAMSPLFQQNSGTLSAKNITIDTVNPVTQSTTSCINATDVTVNSQGDISLPGTNHFSGVMSLSSTNGNISSKSIGVSRVSSLWAPNGSINVVNKGGYIVGPLNGDSSTIVAKAKNDLILTAMSPLTINGGLASLLGVVNLTASEGASLTINAPINATSVQMTGSIVGPFVPPLSTVISVPSSKKECKK
jgi:hypothetical protein